MRLGTAEILEESEDGVFLRDTVSDCFMLAVDNSRIGEHLEGSMGLLEIFPQYRGRGYGTEMERKKLGLTISEERMYWMG